MPGKHKYKKKKTKKRWKEERTLH